MRILDATAGKREMWFNKRYPDVIYMDIRSEMKPDVVGDSTHTNFPDKTFDLIIFDPPHYAFGKTGFMGKKYGSFSKQYIFDFIKDAFIEFNRILKDDGSVIFKWNTGMEKLSIVLGLVRGFEPLFGQRGDSKRPAIGVIQSETYWIYLRKGEIKQSLLSIVNDGVSETAISSDTPQAEADKEVSSGKETTQATKG
jgi:hypothetical protein